MDTAQISVLVWLVGFFSSLIVCGFLETRARILKKKGMHDYMDRADCALTSVLWPIMLFFAIVEFILKPVWVWLVTKTIPKNQRPQQ